LAVQVSVVMPAHNAEEYVSAAVQSALGQTLHEIEVILIDDASTDSTTTTALRAADGDPRLIVIPCTINGGPSVARNIGMDRARGKWIALLDADDTFAPARLEAMLRLAESSEADLLADNLLVTSGQNVSEGEPALPLKFMSKTGRIAAEEFVTWDRPANGLKSVGFMKPLMRTEFLRAHRILYDPRFRNAEDFHFYVRCLLLGAKFHVTSHAWYHYVYRSDSQSRGLEAKYPEQLVRSNEDLEQFAINCDQKAALTALRKRGEEIRDWIPYVAFVTLLRHRRLAAALKQFFHLPSKTYALKQLLRAAQRRIS
jgi:glycosyltransferase involved in cell wall biosynthesis